jgi:Zn-dependent protease with chaperone function
VIRSGSAGKTRRVMVLSDELLFLSPVLPIVLLAFQAQKVWALLVEIICLIGILELTSRIVIFRRRGIKLTEQDAPASYRALRAELQRQRVFLGFGPALYWVPNNFQRGARALGGFRPKILMTGGTIVENEEAPEKAKIILRHELAHIKSGDTRLYLYFLFLFGNALVAFVDAANSFHDGAWPEIIEAAIGLTLSFLYYFRLLLRRREFLADARAVNVSDSRQEYIDVLLSKYSPEETLATSFHPSGEERASAIRYGSPVLSNSNIMVAVALLYILLHTIQLLRPSQVSGDEFDAAFFLRLFLIFNAAPLLVIVLELAKGRRMTYPLALGEKASKEERLFQV